MEDDVLGPTHGLARTRDELLAALAENLDGDIIGDAVFIDQAADEIEFDLRGGRESHFDFLEPDVHEHFEVFEFLLDAHGLGEGLVTVAEIDTAPDRGLGQRATGPLAIGQVNRGKRSIFGDRRGLHNETN